MSLHQGSANLFAPVILIPIYSPDASSGASSDSSLVDLLREIERLDLPVIAIHDAAADQTLTILKQFPSFTLLTRDKTLGRAAALRNGFQTAAAMGFTHALTFKTATQRNPQQILPLLEQARKSPTALILGTRPRRTGIPLRTRLSRSLSHSLLWLETGLHHSDNQSGPRVYPLQLVNAIDFSPSRHGYETEILTRLAWLKVPVIEVPLATPPSQDAADLVHSHPPMDFWPAVMMHARLLGFAAIWRWPRRVARACDPVAAWRQLRSMPEKRHQFAAGVAVGFFFACTPLYGIQGVLAWFVAGWLRGSRLVATAACHISTPPVGLLLIAASMALGHLILYGVWPDPATLHAVFPSQWTLALLRGVILDWFVGSAPIGLALALTAYAGIRAALAAGGVTRAYPAAPGNGPARPAA